MNAHLEKGRILLDQRRYKLAAEELAKAIGAEPENAYAISLHALTLAYLGDIKQALAQNALALAKKPDDSWNHCRSGIIWRQYAQLDNDHYIDCIDRAFASFHEAIRLDPRNPDFYVHLSDLCNQQGRIHSALELADQGLACDPNHIGCLNERARSQLNIGLNAEAAETIDRALRLSPNEAQTHALRGWRELNNRNPRRARAHFLEALRNNPVSANAQHGLDTATERRAELLFNHLADRSMKTSHADPANAAARKSNDFLRRYMRHRESMLAIRDNPMLAKAAERRAEMLFRRIFVRFMKTSFRDPANPAVKKIEGFLDRYVSYKRSMLATRRNAGNINH